MGFQRTIVANVLEGMSHHLLVFFMLTFIFRKLLPFPIAILLVAFQCVHPIPIYLISFSCPFHFSRSILFAMLLPSVVSSITLAAATSPLFLTLSVSLLLIAVSWPPFFLELVLHSSALAMLNGQLLGRSAFFQIILFQQLPLASLAH